MAGRIAWTNEYGNQLSTRHYTEYQLPVTVKADRPEWGASAGRDYTDSLSIYRDEQTGILVTDIAAFENWIEDVQKIQWGDDQ